ncbi:MAG: hypothetical protein BGO10_01145 [Chlamydia sp. 32-24]|nr:MAG: hypothetical protein BGO10_01145 [Chlamydia sp. 32-24]
MNIDKLSDVPVLRELPQVVAKHAGESTTLSPIFNQVVQNLTELNVETKNLNELKTEISGKKVIQEKNESLEEEFQTAEDFEKRLQLKEQIHQNNSKLSNLETIENKYKEQEKAFTKSYNKAKTEFRAHEKEFNKLFEKEKKLLLEENNQLEEQFSNAEDLEQRLKLKEKIHRNEATIKDIDKELTNLEQYFERKS